MILMWMGQGSHFRNHCFMLTVFISLSFHSFLKSQQPSFHLLVPQKHFHQKVSWTSSSGEEHFHSCFTCLLCCIWHCWSSSPFGNPDLCLFSFFSSCFFSITLASGSSTSWWIPKVFTTVCWVTSSSSMASSTTMSMTPKSLPLTQSSFLNWKLGGLGFLDALFLIFFLSLSLFLLVSFFGYFSSFI